MKYVACDIETDALDATRIWIIACQDILTGEYVQFLLPDVVPEEKQRFLDYAKTVDKWVMHNGIQFDGPVINKILQAEVVTLEKIIDTLVVSRLKDYSIQGGHSLDAWGKRLGVQKGYFKDFSKLSDEMIKYCKQDVQVTVSLFNRLRPFIFKPEFSTALRCEHDIQILCHTMHTNGFKFEKDKAQKILDEILERMSTLENGFQKDFPPKLEVCKRLKWGVYKESGEPLQRLVEAMETYPKCEREGDELVVYHYVPFKPSSTPKRIERLWDSGWKPIEKTKGFIDFEREYQQAAQKNLRNFDWKKAEERKKKFEVYGWKCNEENLNTLPENAPDGAKRLAEWLTLEGRRSSLVEWIGQCEEDGRIHGRFIHIGTWTGRLAHSDPNEANIPSAFHGDPNTAVKKVKQQYDGLLRSLWSVEDGCYLVGTDAEGIQLRVLAHLMNSQEYVDAIVYGRKENETDIHNVNKRALNVEGLVRDQAKTFIYAFLLGAGVAKVGSILGVGHSRAKEAIENFTTSISGLHTLKNEIIPYCAQRGFFTGLDGRKVLVPNQHKTLAGMLQNGESTIMKHAALKWIKDAKAEGLVYKLCTWPHDEWQTELKGSYEEAERLGELQRDSIVWAGEELGMFCPLAGSTDIGKNWMETH